MTQSTSSAQSKDCPCCGLVNPPSAQRCDCGWDFQHAMAMQSYVRDHGPSNHALATLGDRAAAQFVDTVIAIGIILLSSIPYAISESIGNATLACGFIVGMGYIAFSDGFRNGQSYGKRLMKTAVVDATTGQPCSFGQSFARNVLLPVLGWIDWVFIFGEKRQRLGDRAANTLVIRFARK